MTIRRLKNKVLSGFESPAMKIITGSFTLVGLPIGIYFTFFPPAGLTINNHNNNCYYLNLIGVAFSLLTGFLIGRFRYKKYFEFGGGFVTKIVEAIERINDNTKDTFKGLYKGWLKQLEGEIDGVGMILEVDSNYYEACLNEIETADVRTIADLNSLIEKFWLDNNFEIKIVKERIFLFDWTTLLIDNNFENYNRRYESYIPCFKAHSAKYPVRIGIIPPNYNPGRLREFENENEREGNDLFVGETNLVGGYIRKGNDRLLLRMVRSETAFQDAEAIYNNFKKNSVSFDPMWDAKHLKEEWIRHNQIGRWLSQWSEVSVNERSNEYFEKYDMNIRCWIPKYDDFIKCCFEKVIRDSILNVFKQKGNTLKILEIGFGTGALTKLIFDWMILFHTANGINLITYYGIDSAMEKMRANSSFFRNYETINRLVRHSIHLQQGTFYWEMPREIAMEGPFDIICSTLVLHDQISNDPNDNFKNILIKAQSMLSDNGEIIIADIFFTSDQNANTGKLKKWKDFLENNLDRTEANAFLVGNTAMVNAIKEEDVKEIANQHGFEASFIEYDRHQAFKILRLVKQKAVSVKASL